MNFQTYPTHFEPTKFSRYKVKIGRGSLIVYTTYMSHMRRCSHCLWCPVTSQTPPPVSPQVGCDHVYMPGVRHHDHPASVGHKLWHGGQRDRELVNSSLVPPHSGQLCPLWAVHRQSLDGPPHKPTGSSPCHPEGRLADVAVTLCRNTSYTQHIWKVDRLDTTYVEVPVQIFSHSITCGAQGTLYCTRQWVVLLGKREQ